MSSGFDARWEPKEASSMNKMWLAPLAVLLAAPAASPDTLIMDNGRRIQGELISINRNVIVFDRDDGVRDGVRDGVVGGGRRLRVDRNAVRTISFDDNVYTGDDDDFTPGVGTVGTGQDVFVRADSPWTETGVFLRAGELFRLDASGTINWGGGRVDGPAGEVGSPYNANRPMPNRPGGALIARVGNGEPFFVGPGQTSFRASTTGRLYLGVNDDYLRDNSGSFRVYVGR
jgi:hypothetical protein